MDFYESDDDFICSQKPNVDVISMQSMDYGGDVIEQDDGFNQEVVSLEQVEGNFDLGQEKLVCDGTQPRRVLYDNVMIEDISSDEELEKL